MCRPTLSKVRGGPSYSLRSTPYPTRSGIPFPHASTSTLYTPAPLFTSDTTRKGSSSRRDTRRTFPSAFPQPSSALCPAHPSLFSSFSPQMSLAVPDTALPQPTISKHVQPFMNAFLVLAVSTVALCTILAVLVAGYTLTLYDDCGKKVEDLQGAIGVGGKRVKGSIEGVKSGVSKVLRGAVETFAGAKRLAMSSAANRRDSLAGAKGRAQSCRTTSEEFESNPTGSVSLNNPPPKEAFGSCS